MIFPTLVLLAAWALERRARMKAEASLRAQEVVRHVPKSR